MLTRGNACIAKLPFLVIAIESAVAYFARIDHSLSPTTLSNLVIQLLERAIGTINVEAFRNESPRSLSKGPVQSLLTEQPRQCSGQRNRGFLLDQVAGSTFL